MVRQLLRPSIASSVFVMVSRARIMSAVLPDMKMRPDAPIIWTSLMIAFGRGALGLVRRDAGEQRGRHFIDQQRGAGHQDRRVAGPVQDDRVLIGDILDDVVKQDRRRQLIRRLGADAVQNGLTGIGQRRRRLRNAVPKGRTGVR